VEILGWLCTLCFGLCYYPQLWRSYKTKSVGDISSAAWLIQLTGYILGLFYGIHLHEWPLISGYLHGFVCTVMFLIMYRRYHVSSSRRTS
jgi:MtN3 and saliva related transmembrane protein